MSSHIKRIDLREELSESVFIDAYNELLDNGFGHIKSIHIHPLLGNSFNLAKDAAKKVSCEDITVINSKSNGLGLGMIIQEIDDLIHKEYSPETVSQEIQKLIENMRYYAASFKIQYHKNTGWLSHLQDNRKKMKLKLFKFQPLISLEDNIEVFDCFIDPELGIRKLLQRVEEESRSRKGKFKRVGVEYKHIYRTAVNVANRLSKYKVPLKTNVAGSVTAHFLGPNMVGICII